MQSESWLVNKHLWNRMEPFAQRFIFSMCVLVCLCECVAMTIWRRGYLVLSNPIVQRPWTEKPAHVLTVHRKCMVCISVLQESPTENPFVSQCPCPSMHSMLPLNWVHHHRSEHSKSIRCFTFYYTVLENIHSIMCVHAFVQFVYVSTETICAMLNAGYEMNMNRFWKFIQFRKHLIVLLTFSW